VLFGPLCSRQASAEDNGADLKARFEPLSQHGNVECSVHFEKSIATMPLDAKLQGSCCAPMNEARYRQQIEGLKKYADITEVPPDPYDISSPLAHTLMGYYMLALNKEEQAAYDYAMQHSDMQGPCCCKCWRWKVYGGLGKYLIRAPLHGTSSLPTSGTSARAVAGLPIRSCTSNLRGYYVTTKIIIAPYMASGLGAILRCRWRGVTTGVHTCRSQGQQSLCALPRLSE
jgi:hypothetical protein